MSVRLLTIDQLSLLRPDHLCEHVADAAAALSAVSTIFDCHLLQRAPGQSLLTTWSTEQQQQLARVDRTLFLRVVGGRDSERGSIPDCFSVESVPATDADVENHISVSANRTDIDFEWTHLQPGPHDDRPVWTAAFLRAAVRAAATDQDQLVIVAALSTGDEGSTRFPSLLWEGAIRAPLWMTNCAEPGTRVSNPTGSFEVMDTILHRLSNLTHQSSSQPNLRRLAVVSQDPAPCIALTWKEVLGLRTPDFFFVQSRTDEDQTALYSKPVDVWNVHNMTHEYPEIAESMARQLHQTSQYRAFAQMNRDTPGKGPGSCDGRPESS